MPTKREERSKKIYVDVIDLFSSVYVILLNVRQKRFFLIKPSIHNDDPLAFNIYIYVILDAQFILFYKAIDVVYSVLLNNVSKSLFMLRK
jgi:hypothetical protein